MDPADPSLGRIHPRMKGMHTATGCECEQIPVSEIRINHYLGSAEDYVEKTKRFWQVGCPVPFPIVTYGRTLTVNKTCCLIVTPPSPYSRHLPALLACSLSEPQPLEARPIVSVSQKTFLTLSLFLPYYLGGYSPTECGRFSEECVFLHLRRPPFSAPPRSPQSSGA